MRVSITVEFEHCDHTLAEYSEHVLEALRNYAPNTPGSGHLNHIMFDRSMLVTSAQIREPTAR